MTDGVWRAVPAALWSRRTWKAFAHLVTGALLWAVPAYLAFGVAAAVTRVGRAVTGDRYDKLFYVLVGLAVFAGALLVPLALTPRFTQWQRARFRAVLGVELAPPDRRRGLGHAWRQVCYYALAGAFSAATAAVAIACLVVGLVLVILPLSLPKLHLSLALVGLGLGLVLAAPWPG